MTDEVPNKEDRIKHSLLNALEECSIGMTDQPVLPLVGSENVPISVEEEKEVE